MAALAVLLCLSLFAAGASAQQAAPATDVPGANADPAYQQLRHIRVGNGLFSAKDFVLKRDAGKFIFRSGVFSFLEPVKGKVTGAVFVGEGTFMLTPPVEMENKMLALLTKQPAYEEHFERVVFRFTDDTDAEIRAGCAVAQGADGGASAVLEESQAAMRKNLHYNLSARILADLLGKEKQGLFIAFIHGTRYSDKTLFVIDPHGVREVAPEEVALRTYEEAKSGIWAAFHYSGEYAAGIARGTQLNSAVDIEHQQLDTKIDKNGMLHGRAATTFVAQSDGVRVVGFDLFHTLRVQKVSTSDGRPLAFIQEDKKEDPDFWIILPKELVAKERFTVISEYEGKEAVVDTGSGNYFPVARRNWYPNSALGDYATYDLRFRIPKGLQMVSTGDLVSDKTEGDVNITEWRSEAPQAVAGFNFGSFKREESKLEKGGYLIQAFANTEVPDSIRQLQRLAEPPVAGQRNYQPMVALGTMNTTTMMKKPLAEAIISMGLYDAYFGPSSYKRIAMTQQTACNYGQSWPELVYMPICSFFDATVRHQLHLDDVRGYWKTVAAHEVAHQWWGHTVGFHCYRDQWMSEGFADFSASMYIQLIQKNQQEFQRFWADEHELLTERNNLGHRAIDMGPVVMGYRLRNTKAGLEIPRRLIYPKGAYILHMIRMMMWEHATHDEKFSAMMKDFVETYRNRPASTEDFKAMVEKHMTPTMNVDGKGNMDWFFNEFVYGTDIPKYKTEAAFRTAADGVHLDLRITQSNVDDSFIMVVPVYIELNDGRVARIGQVRMKGNTTQDQKDIPLRGLTEPPKRALVNYNHDVLAD
jgi:hypothetical protein